MTDKNLNRRHFLGTAGVAAAAGIIAGAKSVQAAEGNKKVKIIAVCGSHRKGKTTSTALQIALDSAKTVSPDIETELIELMDYKLEPAVPGGNAVDEYDKIGPKIADPAVGGIIFGSPVYFSNMTSMMKMFIEHFGPYKKSGALSNKVAGVLTVAGARNGGQEGVAQSITAALLGVEMIMVGDGRPTGHSGATLWNNGKDEAVKDNITKDEFGCATAKGLGKRVAEVALRMAKKS
ncbi:MAG: flavodoxin family protein [Kiritimatiellae bacterium]|nr:flavodoxin family protein [Kiritimatiellia bacterium]MDD5522790.1 flavodoxin family protein [Kiritimatiellia bacterium]